MDQNYKVKFLLCEIMLKGYLIVILAMHLAHWPATSAFLGLIIVYDQKNLSEVSMCHKYEGFFHSENSPKKKIIKKKIGDYTKLLTLQNSTNWL